MKTFLRCLVLSYIFFQFATTAFATHNRAGEIIIEQISPCTSNMVRCTIVTYTKTSSVAADRDTLTLCWGDGTCQQVARVNGPQPNPSEPPQGVPGDNDVKFNLYIATHIYSGPGTYRVSMTDPNRNGGIINVNPPGSENVQFHLQTTFTLFNGQFEGCNSTPLLKNAPVDYACLGQPFVHNPGAYDVDGDSLSYELIVPFQSLGVHVPNYTYPQNVQGNGGCCLNLDPVTGTLEWKNPLVRGEYNIAMIIISWRNGVPIDTTLRDMQILVFDCDKNLAPVINTVDEICVIAGDVVQFDVTATDPNPGDRIRLSAQGAPFDLEISPADDVENWRPNGNPSATYEKQPVTKTFRWQTTCEHISNLEYSVVFKAVDDFFLQNVNNSTGLATLKTVRIKVVGPPPQDVQAKASSEQIDVSWEKPYKCEDAQDNYFHAFTVWRREGSNNFPLDTCAPGLGGKGYVKIVTTRDVVNGRYQITDKNVERGRTYCYRVLAVFARRTDAGFPYNFVESLASKEVCVQLSRDVPLITHVSVLETAASNGRIEVHWVKPSAKDLDTLLNPGPYLYELQRADDFGGGAFTTVATFTSPTYWQLDQDVYFDQVPALDTRNHPYTYKLAFYVNNEQQPLGFSPIASSVFLEIAPTDNINNLSWDFEVPWVNTEYTVFRFNNNTAQWDSIANVSDTFYSDKGLINGREYCYYVRTKGSYGVAGLPTPLINLSQEACMAPIDNVPPCPPTLIVKNICDDNLKCQEGEVLENRLRWTNPMNLCEETDDVVSYNIYYSPIEGGELTLLAHVDFSGDTTYFHEPERGIAGCYAVTALDTFNNESAKSEVICVDNCPNYSLPNTFTPNGDGRNDLYEPYPFCFIESIDLLIFNVWGELVFQTQDPNINWKGENQRGKELPAGTYYYTCKVFEQRVSGTVQSPVIRKGYIDLIR
jgi:gliding motility-associated-like protein